MSTPTLADITQTAPVIKLNGTELSDALRSALVDFRVNMGLSTTGRATLRFIDVGYELSTAGEFALGAAVTFTQQKSGEFFSGLVTGAALETRHDGAPQYVITIDDRSFQLALSQHVDTYLQMQASDIVSKLCSAAGLTASASSMGGPTYDYLVQQGSDLAFIDALTRRNNCVWWVSGTTFNVAKAGTTAKSPTTLRSGDNLRDFSVRASGLRPTAVSVKGWDTKQKQDIVGQGTADSSLTTAATIAGKYGGTSPDSAFGGTAHALAVDQSNPNSQDEATQLATSLNAMFTADAVTARGTMDIDPTLVPGGAVTTSDVGAANGTYTLTEVEHIYNHRGYTTKFVAGPLRQSLLVDSFGTAQPDPGFVNFGLMSAAVTSVSGDGDNAGMVKVKFNGTNGQIESAWARVVSIGGGNNRGSVFLPEVNDEVLLGFERGDTRHPVVIGGLFGKDAMAADSQVISDGKVAYRRITSRTGHVIEMSDGDSDDKKHVKLSTAGGQVMRLGDDKGEITYANGKPFSIKIGTASIEFDDQGNITIKGAKITMTADQDIAISGTNVSAKANAKLALEGSAESGLKGALVSVEASGIAKVKGSMVTIN